MSDKPKKTLADLHAAHDKSVMIPNRIRAALAALLASGDDWAYEPDFMALTKPGISSIDISKYRDQFKDYWAEMPSTNKSRVARVWFPSKKLADKWKENVSG